MNEVGELEVVAVRRVTPRCVRVTFTGPGLSTVESWPDQQLKLMFPPPGRPLRMPPSSGDTMSWYRAYLAMPDRPVMRSYTVRALRGGRLDVDFVLHDSPGPATAWALSAAPGDVIGRYGPSAEYARPVPRADTVLLLGDETALPAVASLLPSVAKAVVWLEVRDAAEEQDLPGARWLHRNGARHGSRLLAAVRELPWPDGSVAAWLAGEAGMVRELRRHLVTERGLPKAAVEFTGYWRRKLTQDDPPTEEDLAEAAERLSTPT